MSKQIQGFAPQAQRTPIGDWPAAMRGSSGQAAWQSFTAVEVVKINQAHNIIEGHRGNGTKNVVCGQKTSALNQRHTA